MRVESVEAAARACGFARDDARMLRGGCARPCMTGGVGARVRVRSSAVIGDPLLERGLLEEVELDHPVVVVEQQAPAAAEDHGVG